MHKLILPGSLAVAIAVVTGGCSRYHIPSPADLPIVYKIDVQQGNVVTQDMLAQLQPGMDKAKVKYVMGTPLVVDVFHQDRWDYIFTDQKRGGERHERHISLYFKNNKLDHIEGDVKAATGQIPVVGRRDSTLNVPAAEKSLVGRLKDKFEGDKTASTGSKDKSEATAGTAEAKAPSGNISGKTETTAGSKASGTAGAGKEAAVAKADPAKNAPKEVEVPEDAPRPHKSIFRRLLEKVGIGDNEGGEYQSGDTKYRDPTNPENNPDSGTSP